ncbi:MAG: CHAT domain-containing protein [Bacteroidota bacterium]
MSVFSFSIRVIILFISFSFLFVTYGQDVFLAELKSLESQADSLVEADEYMKAEPIYRQILEQYEEGKEKDLSFHVLLLSHYADLYVYDRLSNIEREEELLLQAESILDLEAVSPYALSTYYISRTALENEKSNYDNVLGYLQKAHEVCVSRREEMIQEVGVNEAIDIEANTLEWVVSTYQKLTQEDKLVEAYNKLTDFYEQFGEQVDLSFYISLASFRVGRFYQRLDAKKAAFYFDKCINFQPDNQQQVFYSNLCKGFAYVGAKMYDQPKAIIKEMDGFEDIPFQWELNRDELASRYYSEIGDKDNLVNRANRMLTTMNKQGIPVNVLAFKPENFTHFDALDVPVLLTQVAVFLEEIDDPTLRKTSEELFKICLKRFEEKQKRELSNYHLIIYKLIQNRILKLLERNDISSAEKIDLLEMMEKVEQKGRINKLLANRALASNPSGLDAFIKEERELRDLETELKQQEEENDSLTNAELMKVTLELNELQKQIKQENPTLFSLASTDFAFDEFSLPTGTLILKFIEARGELFRIMFSADTIASSHLGEYDPTGELVGQYVSLLKQPEKVDSLALLGEIIYGILLTDIPSAKNIVIIPDLALRYFPFELLPTDEGYLVEKTAIAYQQGLVYLKEQLYPEVVHSQSASFFAPSYSSFLASSEELAVRGEEYDLQGAKEEVDRLSELTDGAIFTEKQASKASFLNLPNKYSVIHLAGHAYLNDEDPELSNLVFSDHEEDNKLYVSEIYGMKSNADLAVLSACNTGVGGYTSGTGVASLSEAFMYAGIPSTVSSLWSAPDQSTKEIMISFYGYLKEGLPKSQALQQAKLDYLKNTSNDKLKHPYYWAAFVLYGNDAPVDLTSSKLPWYYGVLAVLVIGLLGVFLWRRSKAK